MIEPFVVLECYIGIHKLVEIPTSYRRKFLEKQEVETVSFKQPISIGEIKNYERG